jgi:hypothetical protein
MPTLIESWKERRKDKKTEAHWKFKEAKCPLNSFEEYQKRWNFIEVNYSERPSNNGLDLANPAFAFSTKLAKWIKT